MEIEFIERPVFDETGKPSDTERIPVFIGYSVLLQFEEQTGKSINDKNADINLKDALLMFYLAMRSGYKHLRKDCPYDQEEAELILDVCMDQWAKVQLKFFPSQGKKKGTKGSRAAK